MSHALPRRAAPSLDTGLTTHNLYVKVVPADDPDTLSKGLTRQALLYVTSRLPLLQKMGIKVNVQRVRAKDLKNPRLVDAMKKRGIRNLPALTTPNNVFLGVKEIVDIYQRNIKEFEAYQRKGTDETAFGSMDAPEDALDRFYRSDMTMDRAERDAEDEGIGERDTETMMRAYSRMMSRRDVLNKDRKGGIPDDTAGADDRPPARPRPSAGAGTAAAPPRPAPSSRPDNVHQEGDDAEITGMIDRINRELQGGDTAAAFSGTGGGSLEDDDTGDGDPADRFMQQKYWANQEESLK